MMQSQASPEQALSCSYSHMVTEISYYFYYYIHFLRSTNRQIRMQEWGAVFILKSFTRFKQICNMNMFLFGWLQKCFYFELNFFTGDLAAPGKNAGLVEENSKIWNIFNNISTFSCKILKCRNPAIKCKCTITLLA